MPYYLPKSIQKTTTEKVEKAQLLMYEFLLDFFFPSYSMTFSIWHDATKRPDPFVKERKSGMTMMC